jgi:hypothetical protein
MEQGFSSEANNFSLGQKVPYLLRTEGSLPCLKKTTTGPHPETDGFSPQNLRILFL